eukprot:117788_1
MHSYYLNELFIIEDFKISLDRCKSDYVQVADVLINRLKTIKCDWSTLGEIMNVVLSISTECDLDFVFTLSIILSFVGLSLGSSVVRNVIMNLVQPCFDWFLFCKDSGGQKTKGKQLSEEIVMYIILGLREYVSEFKTTKPNAYKRWCEFESSPFLSAVTFSEFKRELVKKLRVFWNDDEMGGRFCSIANDGGDKLLLTLWNLWKKTTLNNSNSKCDIGNHVILAILSNIQILGALCLVFNCSSDGLAQRFTLIFGKPKQVKAQDVTCERKMDGDGEYNAIKKCAKVVGDLILPSFKKHLFDAGDYSTGFAQIDLISAEHARLRACFIMYLNCDGEDATILKEGGKGCVKFVKDVSVILRLNDVEEEAIFSSIPPEGVPFDLFCELITWKLVDYMNLETTGGMIGGQQISKLIMMYNDVGTAEFENDSRVEVDFDTSSPLWDRALEGGRNPHGIIAEAFDLGEKLRFNSTTGPVTKVCSNKFGLKVLRLAPVMSVLSQCIKQHDTVINEFDNPDYTACVRALAFYKNLLKQWQGADSEIKIHREERPRAGSKTRTKGGNGGAGKVLKMNLSLHEKYMYEIKRCKEKYMDGDEEKGYFSNRDVSKNDDELETVATDVFLKALVELGLIKDNRNAGRRNGKYVVVQSIKIPHVSAQRFFAGKQLDLMENWVEYLGLTAVENNDMNNDEIIDGDQPQNNEPENNNEVVGDEAVGDEAGAGLEEEKDDAEQEDVIGAVAQATIKGIKANSSITSDGRGVVEAKLGILKMQRCGPWVGCCMPARGVKYNKNWKSGGYAPQLANPFWNEIATGVKGWDSRIPNDRFGHPFVRKGMTLRFRQRGKVDMMKVVADIYLVWNPKDNIVDWTEIKAYSSKNVDVAILYTLENDSDNDNDNNNGNE